MPYVDGDAGGRRDQGQRRPLPRHPPHRLGPAAHRGNSSAARRSRPQQAAAAEGTAGRPGGARPPRLSGELPRRSRILMGAARCRAREEVPMVRPIKLLAHSLLARARGAATATATALRPRRSPRLRKRGSCSRVRPPGRLLLGVRPPLDAERRQRCRAAPQPRFHAGMHGHCLPPAIRDGRGPGRGNDRVRRPDGAQRSRSVLPGTAARGVYAHGTSPAKDYDIADLTGTRRLNDEAVLMATVFAARDISWSPRTTPVTTPRPSLTIPIWWAPSSRTT